MAKVIVILDVADTDKSTADRVVRRYLSTLDLPAGVTVWQVKTNERLASVPPVTAVLRPDRRKVK